MDQRLRLTGHPQRGGKPRTFAITGPNWHGTLPPDVLNYQSPNFDKGRLPPARGFWSVTMYDADHLRRQPLNRYTLSARDKLTPNPDGSVDFYIQADSPGPDKESNWLPAPKDKFNLMMRLYWPNDKKPSILNGTWHIPPSKPFP